MALLFGLIFAFRWFHLYRLAAFLVSSGVVTVVWFSNIGWSQLVLVDLLLNQISVLLTYIGLGVFVLGDSLNPLGILMTLIGLGLVGLGRHFHSPIPLDQILETDETWNRVDRTGERD